MFESVAVSAVESVFESVGSGLANETAPGRCLRTESEGLATPSPSRAIGAGHMSVSNSANRQPEQIGGF